jgi:hypothetical protein
MRITELALLICLTTACTIGFTPESTDSPATLGDSTDTIDERPEVVDADGDGYEAGADDCDDIDPTVNVGEAERCDDGIDDDCDGAIDEGCEEASGPVDADGDGYTDMLDCDDGDATVNPGALEICGDRVDNNCDGDLDEEDEVACPADADGDGWEAEDDCDDVNDTVHPYATEQCNDLDDDCDGEIDEDAADADTWYLDADGDGYGDETSTLAACDTPALYVSASPEFDCDDLDASSSPTGTETCDEADNDCDGEVDGEVCIQTISVTYDAWTTAMYPTHSGGDCEYAANCTASFELSQRVSTAAITGEVIGEWLESVADYTAASLYYSEVLYEAPSGCTIVAVRDASGTELAAGDSDTVSVSYSDSDHSADYLYPGGFCAVMVAICDTDGDDACNNTSDDNALRSVEFEPVEIDLTGSRCVP